MFETPGFRGVVTKDGKRFLADDHAGFKGRLVELADEKVMVHIARRVSPNQRGYWRSEVVPRFAAAIHEPSLLSAHYQLLYLLDWVPGAPRPSTSDRLSNHEVMESLIARAQVLIAQQGLYVEEPERNPIVRHERALRTRR